VWGQQGVANELGGPGDALAQKLPQSLTDQLYKACIGMGFGLP